MLINTCETFLLKAHDIYCQVCYNVKSSGTRTTTRVTRGTNSQKKKGYRGTAHEQIFPFIPPLCYSKSSDLSTTTLNLRHLFPESDGSVVSACNKRWLYRRVLQPPRGAGVARGQSCHLFSSKCIPDDNLKTRKYYNQVHLQLPSERLVLLLLY
jgi:hypothetical protein